MAKIICWAFKWRSGYTRITLSLLTINWETITHNSNNESKDLRFVQITPFKPGSLFDLKQDISHLHHSVYINKCRHQLITPFTQLDITAYKQDQTIRHAYMYILQSGKISPCQLKESRDNHSCSITSQMCPYTCMYSMILVIPK